MCAFVNYEAVGQGSSYFPQLYAKSDNNLEVSWANATFCRVHLPKSKKTRHYNTLNGDITRLNGVDSEYPGPNENGFEFATNVVSVCV